MENLFDYLAWRGDLSFSEASQNEIDGLIFSELSYVPFEDVITANDFSSSITLEEASKRFFEAHGENYSLGAILPPEILVLLKECASSKRFSKVRAWAYVNQICLDVEKQFSAICFSCDNKVTYVVYRGTDDTIVGWKEDLNMALFTPIPAQREGVKYIAGISKLTRDKLIIVGHSKGGNVAVYTGLNIPSALKKRVLAVYSYDGPGFKESYIKAFENDEIVGKIKSFLPTKSVIGRIFDVIGDYKIVKSRDKGLRQHDAFTWRLCGASFIEGDHFEAPSDNFHELLKVWVSNLTPMERRDFVDSFYKLLKSTDAQTLTDITNKKFKFLIALIKSSGSDKKIVFDAIVKLLKEKSALDSTRKSAQKKARLEEKKKKKAE